MSEWDLALAEPEVRVANVRLSPTISRFVQSEADIVQLEGPRGEGKSVGGVAAMIYHALGIPSTAAWKDDLDRPHHIYHGEPIFGLL